MNIMDVNLNKIVTNSKSFEELTESEKMLLALKGALEKFKITKDEENAFYAAFIVKTIDNLKELGYEL